MARIRVVTDSACDLSRSMAADLGVTIVPLSIRFGDEEFIDGVSLTPTEFWAKCKASAVLPETAAPSPGAFQEAFRSAADEGYDGVLCITLSAGVSATYQAAVNAAKALDGVIPVRVIDSMTLTVALGLLVIDLAERAAAGDDLDQLEARAIEQIPHTRVLGVLDTLDHLAKGGRIGGASQLLGSLLSIKPVLTVIDGAVAEESKQRTRSRSLRYLAEQARAAAPLRRLAVSHGAADDLDDCLALLADIPTEHPVVVTDLGPVIGTHAGPGTIGVCWISVG